MGGHDRRPRLTRAVVAAAALVVAAGCAGGGSEPEQSISIGTKSADLPADELTAPGAVVKPGEWGVVQTAPLTAEVEGVPKGTRSHMAIRVDSVTAAEAGSIPADEVQQLGDAIDLSQAVPYHVQYTSAVLSGWKLEFTDHMAIDQERAAGEGELRVLSIQNTQIEACSGMEPNPQVINDFGVERRHCEVVLGTGTARPTTLEARTFQQEPVRFELPEPAPAG